MSSSPFESQPDETTATTTAADSEAPQAALAPVEISAEPEGSIPVVILGASGYVAGELLRLLSLHPIFEIEAAISSSQVGARVADIFPHLAGAPGDLGELDLVDASVLERVLAEGEGDLAVFTALPHGASAREIDLLLTRAKSSRRRVHLVDLSADFRLGDAALHERVYGAPHEAPARLPEFTCALPDLEHVTPPGPIAHPGCFTTAVTLAIAPLTALGLAEPSFFASAVTGSTGAGRTPVPGTHHPERHGNLRAYNPLAHRHAPEMEQLAARATDGEQDVRVLFAPHSGPFARGIHATVHARLTRDVDAASLVASMAGFYAHTPFVEVTASPPTLKSVVGTNRAQLGVAVRDRDAVVFSVIDNLTKGASGGALQWMNRLCGLAEATGLILPGLGWS